MKYVLLKVAFRNNINSWHFNFFNSNYDGATNFGGLGPLWPRCDWRLVHKFYIDLVRSTSWTIFNWICVFVDGFMLIWCICCCGCYFCWFALNQNSNKRVDILLIIWLGMERKGNRNFNYKVIFSNIFFGTGNYLFMEYWSDLLRKFNWHLDWWVGWWVSWLIACWNPLNSYYIFNDQFLISCFHF